MKIKKYSIPVIIVAILIIISVTVACTTSKSSSGDTASAQNNTEALPSASPSPVATDAASENTTEVTDTESNKPKKRISLEEEIATEKAAGITVDGTHIGRVMVAPNTSDEKAHPVYYPVYGKYHLERTNPDTGEKTVSVDNGTTWLHYRMNETTKAQEISVDGMTWADLTAAIIASDYCNCMFYLSKNDPGTGKALNLVSYDYGKTWMHERYNDQTHAHEVSADGSTWQSAPTEW